jgi:DNA (cytosine-5)-methyltransferase 1
VVLDASYCNTPQARKRFFLIGSLNDKNNQLLPIFEKNLNDRQMTVRDYLGNKLDLDYYYRHPRNYNRRGIFSIDEPSPTVRGVNRPIPAGYKKHSGDPESIRLEDMRPLTTIERSYLQTFPEDFKLIGTKTDLEQMVGNAVPVNLATFVARGILEYLKKEDIEPKGQQEMFMEYQEFKMPNKTLHRTQREHR